jgi:hypothetical protein
MTRSEAAVHNGMASPTGQQAVAKFPKVIRQEYHSQIQRDVIASLLWLMPRPKEALRMPGMS